ncbi:hypothetical protein [Thermaurantiacus sp.]
MTKRLSDGASSAPQRPRAERPQGKPKASEPQRPSRTRPRPARSELRSGAPLAPWSAAEKSRFLNALARSGSLETALRLSGRTRASAFEERLRDPRFALAWDEATDCELDVLRMRLVACALEYSGPEAGGKPMPADLRAAHRLALQILKTCRAPSEHGGAPAAASRGAAPRSAGQDASSAPRAPEAPAGDPLAVQAEIDSLLGQVIERLQLAESRAAGARPTGED